MVGITLPTAPGDATYDAWTVVIIDFGSDTGTARDSQLSLVIDSLLPKGFELETFAGKAAHVLDEERVAELTSFVEDSMRTLEVPGVALGIIADGKVVFSGGFGVRELGKPEKPDGDTKFMIASNTKPFTTLMLAKLVDDNKLRWDQPATTALSSFKLGDPAVTRKVQIKHLLCACTGIPREDERFRYRFTDRTAADVLVELGRTQPITKFGELFQYSNVIAAAAGFVGGHVAFPQLELGNAYDEAMRTLVWEPLGMTSTTFDYHRAQTGNFATPHTPDHVGKTVAASNRVNEYMIPLRPAAGAWSSVNDLLKYIQMELADGKLPDGTQYIGKPALFARREKQIAIDGTSGYGMGLMIDRASGAARWPPEPEWPSVRRAAALS